MKFFQPLNFIVHYLLQSNNSLQGAVYLSKGQFQVFFVVVEPMTEPVDIFHYAIAVDNDFARDLPCLVDVVKDPPGGFLDIF